MCMFCIVSNGTKEKMKVIPVRESVHTLLKIKAAQLGVSLQDMCGAKLEELLDDPNQPKLPLEQNVPALAS